MGSRYTGTVIGTCILNGQRYSANGGGDEPFLYIDNKHMVFRGNSEAGYWIPSEWLVNNTVSDDTSIMMRELEAARAEIEATLSELKSTGHKYEGASLSHLVDRAIDREREKHLASLGRIAKALSQDWVVNARGNADEICAFLINVITHHWQKKPLTDEGGVDAGAHNDTGPFTITADDIIVGEAPPVASVGFLPVLKPGERALLKLNETLTDDEISKLKEEWEKLLGESPVLLQPGVEFVTVSRMFAHKVDHDKIAKSLGTLKLDFENFRRSMLSFVKDAARLNTRR